MDFLRNYWKWLAAGAVGIGILAYAARADAADLGGTCCSDLEERIADLEATVARKGNRSVSLVVAGQINKALFYYDADDFGLGSNTHVIENGTSETFVSFSGAAQIRPGFHAGYTLELGQGTTGIELDLLGTAGVGTDNDVYTRQSYAFLKSSDLGTLSIGLQSMATDDLVSQSVARTGNVSKRLTAQPIGGISISVAGIELFDIPLEPFNGKKANAVRYMTPTWQGFAVSAAWNSEDDSWDATLTYAGEQAGFLLVGGLGYYDDKTNDMLEALGPFAPAIGSTTLTVNGGVKHMVSGVFVQGTWARLDFDAPVGLTTDAWHVQAGIETRVFAVGQTTVFGEVSEWSDLDLTFYGLGINQQLGDAVDLYAGVRRYELGGGDVDTAIGGVRIKF